MSTPDRAAAIIARAAAAARAFAERIGATGTDHVYHVGWLESEIHGLCSELAGYANPASCTPAYWRHTDVGVLYDDDDCGIRITGVYLRGVDILDGMANGEIDEIEEQLRDRLLAAALADIGPEVEHAQAVAERRELRGTQAISEAVAEIRSWDAR